MIIQNSKNISNRVILIAIDEDVDYSKHSVIIEGKQYSLHNVYDFRNGIAIPYDKALDKNLEGEENQYGN